MKNPFWLCFLILTNSFTCLSQVYTDNFTTSEGHKLQAVAKPEKETIMFGETTYIVFEIKNFSNQDLFTGVGGDYRNNIGRPDTYKVTVVREDGKPVSQPKVTYSGGGFFGAAEIPANGSYKKKLYLPHWATFVTTGNYTITVSQQFPIDNRSNKIRDMFYAETSTKIKIVPTTQNELGKVIDDLGMKMLDTEAISEIRFENPADEAANLLWFIKDNRTIKYFAQALENYSNANDWETNWTYRGLARTLSKFKDNSALVALKKVMFSKNQNLRFDVAEALMYSKHPQALKILLQMQDDSYYFVRLRVLQAYGKVDSAESRALFRKMLNDENEDVRTQAKGYQKKRNRKI